MQDFFNHTRWWLSAFLVLGGMQVAQAQKPVVPAHPGAVAKVAPAAAMVQVQNAWVRATVPGQKVAAAYMQLQAQVPGLRLQALRSPAAASVQLHDMQMHGEIMRMVEVKTLDLPLGQTVVLAPSGMHIMLMDLAQPLLAGSSISVQLLFADGRQQKLTLPVLNAAPEHATNAVQQGAHTEHGAGHAH